MKLRFLLFMGVLLGSFGLQAAPLITPKEAKLPDAAGSLNTRGISRGPTVKCVSPEPGAPVKGPFEFKVTFEPRGGSSINASSVKVTYLKSPTVDLTSRVKSSLSDSGIDMKHAEIPPGEHQVKVSVQDSDGRESSTIVTLVGAK